MTGAGVAAVPVSVPSKSEAVLVVPVSAPSVPWVTPVFSARSSNPAWS